MRTVESTMLRRTRIKPAHIENLLRWVLLAALLYVVLKALFGIPARPEPLVATLIVLVAIAEPILSLIAARGYLQNRALVLTLFQVAIVSALYSLTGGARGDAHPLCHRASR